MKSQKSTYEPPSLTNPSLPDSADRIGGDLGRPTLFQPGQKAQIDVSGMKTNRPGFKFPSRMWTE